MENTSLSDPIDKQENEQVLHATEVKRRSFRGIFAIAAKSFLTLGVTIVAQFILGGVLSPTDYGIYGIVVTVTNFFTIISDIGLAASLIQKKEEPTVQELRTVFTVQQILAWIVCLLLSLSAAGMYSIGKLSMDGVFLAIAFGLSFPIVSLKTISSILLERELDFTKLVIPAIIENVVFNIVLVSLALNGYGVMSFTYAVLIKAVVGVATMLYYKRWSVGISFSKEAFQTLMRVAGAFQLNDILAKVKDDVFYITVALVIPANEYGYITWAKQWSRQPYSFSVDNVSPVLFPSFARLQHDKPALKRAIEKTIFFITLIAFPLFAGLSFMAYPLTELFPKYARWQPALLSLGLFSFSLAFAAFSTPLVSALNAIGQVSRTLKMMIFWTVSQWVLFPFLFRWFGFNSVAIVGALLAVTSFAVVWLVQKDVSFRFVDQIWRQAVASIIMIFVLWIGQSYWSSSFLLFVVGVLCGAATFTGMMGILGFQKTKLELLSIWHKK
jgi:O-antigen/teichoic acid export membrane protein